MNFFTYFHYFILFWGTIFWHSIARKYFMIWYLLEYSIMQMFDYLTRTSAINLKDFIVESINYLGWKSNLSIRPPKLFKYCLQVSMNTNLIILANNTKWVFSQLFGCGRAKLGPRKGTSSPPNVYHWVITSLTCRSHGHSYNRLGH